MSLNAKYNNLTHQGDELKENQKMYQESDFTPQGAQSLDDNDPLKSFRQEFCFPCGPQGKQNLYFAGHSLGLRPKQTESFIQEELEAWGQLGITGYFESKTPWLSYYESVTPTLATLVGAKESEVVAMNTLTSNLHLMLVSFYRPTPKRYRILIENNTFPSDRYALDSQIRFHGFDPKQALIELNPDCDMTVSQNCLLETIRKYKDSLALVMLGNCNYLSGQYFEMNSLIQTAKSVGAMVGFDLAHGIGNLKLKLHQWGPDFAVWCSYKYLNGGPGAVAGAFVHERHHSDRTLPRFEGWWGTCKQTRFQMHPKFDPIPSVEAWQLSNSSIFSLAALRSSLDIFERATMESLLHKRDRLTQYLEELLQQQCQDQYTLITPPGDVKKQTRGAMLSIRFHDTPKSIEERLKSKGAIVDFRRPDIIRITPAPLYNSYFDIYQLVQILRQR